MEFEWNGVDVHASLESCSTPRPSSKQTAQLLAASACPYFYVIIIAHIIRTNV
jgi:hypothetical protein